MAAGPKRTDGTRRQRRRGVTVVGSAGVGGVAVAVAVAVVALSLALFLSLARSWVRCFWPSTSVDRLVVRHQTGSVAG